MMNKTACPLDCYDSCSIIYENNKIKPDQKHPVTKGFLCPFLNKYENYERIKKPLFMGKEIEMDEALDILEKKLKEYEKKDSILYRGSGNLGKMQEVTNLFFSKYGSFLTKGSLCDSAGHHGIVEGRGANLALSPSVVKKSETVILWGRNISVTNSHLMPFLKDKYLIVIDPVKTDIAKRADLFVQIKPRSDFYLALLLSRVAHMEMMEDEEFLEERTENFEDYFDFFRSYLMKDLMNRCGINLNHLGDILYRVKDKKTSILVGGGVQKYNIGSSVLRAIDSFAATLGLFGKEGCGVGFLGDSSYGFAKPFETEAKRVPKAEVDFNKYDFIFIQGANPAVQAPQSKRAREGIKNGFSVYFGLFENETSRLCDLVIPAKNFLEKEDIRLSYSHEYILLMPKLKDVDIGISEYELTCFLSKKFGFEELKSEKEYIDEILKSNSFEEEGFYKSKSYKDIPYKEGFYTDSKKFVFIDELDDDYEDYFAEELEDEDFFLITAKHKNSLNSQFGKDEYLYMPPLLGYSDFDKVKVTTQTGSAVFETKISDRLRGDTLLLYSSNPKANFLTPSISSDEGENAVFNTIARIEKV